MKENCLKYWLEDNVLDYDSCPSSLDFEIEVFDFSADNGNSDTVYVGAMCDIPDSVLAMGFVNIEFAGIKDARTVIFNVDSET